MVRIATASRMSAAPLRLSKLQGSPNTRMPITIAVSGSNAPSIATMVLSMRRSDIVTQMLLSAVGIKPSSMMLIQHSVSGTVSMRPSVVMLYAASSIIPMKNT